MGVTLIETRGEVDVVVPRRRRDRRRVVGAEVVLVVVRVVDVVLVVTVDEVDTGWSSSWSTRRVVLRRWRERSWWSSIAPLVDVVDEVDVVVTTTEAVSETVYAPIAPG